MIGKCESADIFHLNIRISRRNDFAAQHLLWSFDFTDACIVKHEICNIARRLIAGFRLPVRIQTCCNCHSSIRDAFLRPGRVGFFQISI